MKTKRKNIGNSLTAGLLFVVLVLVVGPYIKDRYFLYKNERAYAARYNSGDRSFQTYSQLGLIYEKKGEYDRAVDLMQEFLRENPDHEDRYAAYIRMAVAYHLKAGSDAEGRQK